MKPYHLAWLSIHPERTAEWLAERLSDGFDVHHIDGDRGNNDPSNLMLVETRDHARLHGNKTNFHRALGAEADDLKAARSRIGRECYRARQSGLGWREVDRIVLGIDTPKFSSSLSCSRAASYAQQNGLPWPIKISECASLSP